MGLNSGSLIPADDASWEKMQQELEAEDQEAHNGN
jgi:hypothetical protein